MERILDGRRRITTANIVYKTLGFNRLNGAFYPASAFVSADRYKARNPQRFIHATVVHNFGRMIFRYLSLTLIFFLSLNSTQGQETKLYNVEGKLKIDTLLKYDIKERETITIIEEYLLPSIYTQIEYPLLAYENNIEGIVICRLIYSKPNKLEISTVKSPDKFLENATLKAIKSIEDRICRYLNAKTRSNEFEFFIPIVFEIEENQFEKNLEEKNAITVRKEALTKQKMLIIN